MGVGGTLESEAALAAVTQMSSLRPLAGKKIAVLVERQYVLGEIKICPRWESAAAPLGW